jgi:hypothetical protein
MKEVSNVSESSMTPKVHGSTLKLLHSAWLPWDY